MPGTGKEDPLAGYGWTVGVLGTIFLSLIFGLGYSFDPNPQLRVYGYGVLLFFGGGFIGLFLREYVVVGMKGPVMVYFGHKGLKKKPETYVFQFRDSNVEEITEKDDRINVNVLKGMISPSERYLPFELRRVYQKAITESGGKNNSKLEIPQHHFYLLYGVMGNYVGPFCIITQAPLDDQFKFFEYMGQMVGKFARLWTRIAIGAGQFRGFARLNTEIDLNKIQRFLQVLRLRDYNTSISQEVPVYYTVYSPLHAEYPALVLMPNTITEEWIRDKADDTLAVMTAPLKGELREAIASDRAKSKLNMLTFKRTYLTKPSTVKVVSENENPSRLSKNAKFAITFLIIMGALLFVYSYYNPSSPQAQSVSGFNDVVTPQSNIGALINQGGRVKSCDIQGTCIVSMPIRR